MAEAAKFIMSAPVTARNATLQDAGNDENSARRIFVAARRPLHSDESGLVLRAERVAAIAAAHAAAVDRESRFPREAIEAMRAERLMGVAIERELGGEGASLSDVADICYTLGRYCASTAMIYAMHQATVACLVRHGKTTNWHQGLLRRLSSEQLLLASSTTEGQAGGDVRNSAGAVSRSDAGIALERQATVISYGAAADAIVTTARRSAEAASGDQVLVVFLKGDYALESIAGWDAFGMRGTCSEGFKLTARGRSEQILPASYGEIHVHTMVPVAHLLWSAAWAGIAAAAADRARAFVRRAVHRPGGSLPPGAKHLTRANASMRMLRSLIAGALQRFETISNDPSALEAVDFQTAMNLLKVNASELAVETVMSAMQACGLSGYRNDGEFSVGRHLRDILSSPIMISNDRILNNVAGSSLLSGAPRSLRD
ncbi:MAG TPA: acyl-CoA dehydrogenase family protein [Xanthobacteraceae bacterium]|nr:acyl-CoA dehydrogenase family protein [Xanthobacteraceae bacterium]